MIPHAPILAIVLPLFTAFVMPVIGILVKRYNIKYLRELVAIIVMVTVLALVGTMAPDVWGGEIIVYKLGGWSPPWGIVLTVDALSTQMALMIAILGTLVVIYSTSYMSRDSGLSYFYTLILLVFSGMLGIVLTGDFFNFYVFLEIMSISSYALVSFRRDALSIEAGMKYLLIGSLGTSFVLLSVVMLYGAVGSLNIADLAVKLAAYSATNVPTVLVIS
ncbi:MAG: proton-conducting transporter membrane subunit, partial [Candidatus Hadarchaeum sp.]